MRERAVRMCLESEWPIKHVADGLGIHPESLRTWVRQAEDVLALIQEPVKLVDLGAHVTALAEDVFSVLLVVKSEDGADRLGIARSSGEERGSGSRPTHHDVSVDWDSDVLPVSLERRDAQRDAQRVALTER